MTSGTLLCRAYAERNSAIDFKQAGAALTAADAHRYHAPFGLAPAAFLEDMAGQPRAGHAEGMTDRDRAAIDVVLVVIDAELIARIEALAGERLVELPDVDIIHFQTLPLQQLRHGVDRADAHLVRLAARRRPGDKAAHRLQTALFPVLCFPQHNGRRAIRKLAGVAGGGGFFRGPPPPQPRDAPPRAVRAASPVAGGGEMRRAR